MLPANGLTLRDRLWFITARFAGYVLNSLTALSWGALGSHQGGVLDKHLAFTSDFINPDSAFLDYGKVLLSESKCYEERKEEGGVRRLRGPGEHPRLTLEQQPPHDPQLWLSLP